MMQLLHSLAHYTENCVLLSATGFAPDDSPHYCYNQLVAPAGSECRVDVAYLGALIDKWLGWASLWNDKYFCSSHSKQPPLGGTDLYQWKFPSVIPIFKFIVLLLLLLLAGDIELNPGPNTGKPIMQCIYGKITLHNNWVQITPKV